MKMLEEFAFLFFRKAHRQFTRVHDPAECLAAVGESGGELVPGDAVSDTFLWVWETQNQVEGQDTGRDGEDEVLGDVGVETIVDMVVKVGWTAGTIRVVDAAIDCISSRRCEIGDLLLRWGRSHGDFW